MWTCPFLPRSRRLALGQHFMLVCHRRRFRRRLCDETGAHLEFDPLHLVFMQVLLNQIAFSFEPSLHAWRDVWDHPRHEELHHKDHMLRRKNYHTVKIRSFNSERLFFRGRSGDKAVLSYFHDDNEGHFGCQDVPELHGVSVLLLVAWRVTVITVSVRNNIIQSIMFH